MQVAALQQQMIALQQSRDAQDRELAHLRQEALALAARSGYAAAASAALGGGSSDYGGSDASGSPGAGRARRGGGGGGGGSRGSR